MEASGDIVLATFPEFAEKTDATDATRFNTDLVIKEANNLFLIGDYYEARTKYTLILQNDPQNIHAWNNIGRVYEKLIMYDKAIECFDKAIEINVRDPVIWYNKGNVLARLNRFDDALECYNSAIQLNSKDPSFWKNKAYVLSKLGRDVEAKQCFDTASSLSRQSTI